MIGPVPIIAVEEMAVAAFHHQRWRDQRDGVEIDIPRPAIADSDRHIDAVRPDLILDRLDHHQGQTQLPHLPLQETRIGHRPKASEPSGPLHKPRHAASPAFLPAFT